MSALGGIWNFDARPGAADACRRILDAQRPYGPHGTAQWDDGAVALGRALFEILPEDRYDRQPLIGGEGRFALVADVRLDNRDELIRELAIDPMETERLPDAAFILRAWERWQELAFDKLYGDYAFALWDGRERKLVLARDALGGKPLHYHMGDGFLAFASMPRGLHALPEIPIAPDEQRVAETLALVPETGPRSFFAGISRVEGAHYVVITRKTLTAHRHWNPTPQSIGTWRGGDPLDAFRSELDRAVAVRLRGAENHVASHLSGGMDSAAVAATAARLMAATGGEVTAYTSVPRKGYDGPAPQGRTGDEGPLASATAALYPNIEHVLIRPDGRSPLDGGHRTAMLLDRPQYNPCNQSWVDAIAADAERLGVGVMLTGAMGNMTVSYAGMELLPELVRAGALVRLFREGSALVAKGGMRWRGVLAAAFGPWFPKWLWVKLVRWRTGATMDVTRYTAIRSDRAASMKLDQIAKERELDLSYRPRRDAFESRLWVLRRVDQANFNKAALGAFGVDHRDPTADRRLVEFCLSLPTAEFLNRGEIRVLGKRALADRLPPEVLASRQKGYQAVDWHEGLSAGRRELASELSRFEEIPAVADLLDLPRMQALIHDWPEGGWERPEIIEKYRLTILRGGAVGDFLRRASRTNR